MRVNEGESVTLAIAGADVTLKVATVTEMFLDRIRGQRPGEAIQDFTTTLAIWPPALGAEWKIEDLGSGWKYAGVARGENGEPDARIIARAIDGEHAWLTAIAKASELGGQLPSKREAALCFANIPELIGEGYAWTREPFAGNESYAWCQGFNLGNQNDDHKDDQLRAFAVRRLPI